MSEKTSGKITAAVIVVSDAKFGEIEAKEFGQNSEQKNVIGLHTVRILEEAGVEVVYKATSSDDVREISEAVQTAAYNEVDLIFTTGGTGISAQDYTARAMDPLLRFDIPGIAEQIRQRGVENGYPQAILSRGRAGVLVSGRHRTLVVNASGNIAGVDDALAVLLPILEYAVEEMRETPIGE